MENPPLAHELLRHRDFLLRLATRLVGRDDADDLAQDVWTRALEYPHPDGSGARAWLARVARNLAANRFRARTRRTQREQAAARPEGGPEPLAEVEERFELAQRVSAAVGALEEPYRELVLLRFFEGLSHAEIAARIGAPLATVRTRQQRALARLRERLDREHGGREAWSVALSAWVAANTPIATAVGTFGVVSAFAAAAACLLLGVGAWMLAREAGGGSEPAQALVAVAPAPAPAASAADEVTPSAAPAPRRPLETTAAAPAPAARQLAHGRVLGLDSEELRTASVSVAGSWTRYSIQARPVTGVLRGDGSFEVALDALLDSAPGYEPDELVVVLEHPLHLRTEARVRFGLGVAGSDGTTRHDCGAIDAEDAAALRGTVLLPGGAPARDAIVDLFLLEHGLPREHAAVTTRCDADGRFDLRVGQSGPYVAIALVEGLRPGHVVAQAIVGRTDELIPIELERGWTLSGRCLRLGQPLAQGRVSMVRASPGKPLLSAAGARVAWIDGRCEWSFLPLQADAQGRFERAGMAAGEIELYAFAPATSGTLGFRREPTRATLPAGPVDVELGAALVTLERATGVEAAPIAGRLRVALDGQEQGSFPFAASASECTFEAPPNTALALSVEFEGLAPIAFDVVTPGPGEELRRTVSVETPPEPAVLELEWDGDARLALDALRVYFETQDAQPRFDMGFHASDAPERVFRCEDVPPGRHRVRIRAGFDHLVLTPALERVLELELRPGETVRLPLAFELGGQLSVAARDPAGALRAAEFRLLDARGERVPVTFHAKRGDTTMLGERSLTPWSANVSAALPEGEYELVLWAADVAELRVPVRIEAGEMHTLEVTLQPK